MNQAKLDQEFLKAIQYNKLALVKRLHSDGANVNCRNEEGRSPLHLSIYSEWDPISRYLIASGADPGRQRQIRRHTRSHGGV